MTVPTYGEFVDRAWLVLARAMAMPVNPCHPEELRRLAHGLEAARRAIHRHAEFAADPQRGSTRHGRRSGPADALAEALRPAWLPVRESNGGLDNGHEAWLNSAQCLGAAGDLLATHFGPHGRDLTADARRMVHADGRRQLTHEAARFADTTTEYLLHVAQRIAVQSSDSYGRDLVALWFEHGGLVRAAAYRALNDTAPPQLDMLTDMAPAPLLHREPISDLDGAFRAFDRLRRLCHAQALDELRADVDTVRGFVALGYTITGCAYVVHTAVAEQATHLGLASVSEDCHRQAADRFKRANAAWGDVHAQLADIRDTGGAPAGWRDDALGIREQLDRLMRRRGRLLPPDQLAPDLVSARSLLSVTARFSSGLAGISSQQHDCFRRLYRSGQLHVPTRQIENADVPRLYAPIPDSRINALLVAYGAVSTATRDAAFNSARTGDAPRRRPRTESRSANLARAIDMPDRDGDARAVAR